MRLTKFSAVCGLFALGMSVALSAVKTHATPTLIDDIVLGNMGPGGDAVLDSGNTALVGSSISGNAGNRWAIPFTTGADPKTLELTGVHLGLFDPGASSTAVLRIVNSGTVSPATPTGSLVAQATRVISAEAVYKFSFANVPLAPNTTYWVTLEDQNPTVPNGFSWMRGEVPASPTAQNSSGYAYPTFGVIPNTYSAMRSQNNGAWTGRPEANTLSISITAVPEPTTYALAAAGLGMAGFFGSRRRKAGRAPAKV